MLSIKTFLMDEGPQPRNYTLSLARKFGLTMLLFVVHLDHDDTSHRVVHSYSFFSLRAPQLKNREKSVHPHRRMDLVRVLTENLWVSLSVSVLIALGIYRRLTSALLERRWNTLWTGIRTFFPTWFWLEWHFYRCLWCCFSSRTPSTLRATTQREYVLFESTF